MNDQERPYNGQIDEALLTAYALEQLEGPERALVEAALKTDHKAQEAVEEIRAVAGHLRDAAAHDEEYAPSATLRAMIEGRLEGTTPAVVGEGEGNSPNCSETEVGTVPKTEAGRGAEANGRSPGRRWAFLVVAAAAVLLVAVTIPSLPMFQLGKTSNVAMDMAPSQASLAEPEAAAPSVPLDTLATDAEAREELFSKQSLDTAAMGDKSSPTAGVDMFAGKGNERFEAAKAGPSSQASEAGRMNKSGPAATLEAPADRPLLKGTTGLRTARAREEYDQTTPAPTSQPGVEAKVAAGRRAAVSDSVAPAEKSAGAATELPGLKSAAPAPAWSLNQAIGPVATPLPYPTGPASQTSQTPLAESRAMVRGKSASGMPGPATPAAAAPLPPAADPFATPAPAAMPSVAATEPQQQVDVPARPEGSLRRHFGQEPKPSDDQAGRQTETAPPLAGPTAGLGRMGGQIAGTNAAPSKSESEGLEFGAIQPTQPTSPAAPAVRLEQGIPDSSGLGPAPGMGLALEGRAVSSKSAMLRAYGGVQVGGPGGMGGYGGGMGGGFGPAAPSAGDPMQDSYGAQGQPYDYTPTVRGLAGAYNDAMRRVTFGANPGIMQPMTTEAEQYAPIVENPFQSPVTEPESTVSADVDTASYANVRRLLENNQVPPPGAVRVEEMVNYFSYDYPQPKDDTPFSVDMETASCPWNESHRLVRIGLKAKEIDPAERGPSNLVFLLDVSGSMRDANKLPLVKDAMAMLVDQLTEDDRVSIVTYAGDAGLALESTEGTKRKEILERIEALEASGSTHGSAGIQMAYDQAMAHFVPKGNNRVILCTDGDLNVGITDDNELVKLIQEKASSGVFLTVVGFGTGNLKDAKLEQLADKGNGKYVYVDGLTEAKKVFVEQVSGSLVTVAKDVKIQVEFNPAKVQSYRLVGYENRLLGTQDFADDMKDAGEIGAGHTVTFLYEVVPTNLPVGQIAALNNSAGENLRYQRIMTNALTEVAESGELLALKLRYKLPNEEQSRLLEMPVKDSDKRFGEASSEFRFAAAVAAFGMLLRGSQYNQGLTFSAVEEFAAGAADNDREGRRGEFVDLVRRARTLYGDTTQVGADAIAVPPAAAAAPAEQAPAEAAPAER